MDDTVIAKHLENLDHRLANVEQILLHGIEPRLARVEQILPTLATTEALHTTEAALRQEIREEGGRSRRHMDIIAESLRSDIQLLAEHAASTSQRKRPEQ